MDKVFKCGIVIIDITEDEKQIAVGEYILDQIIKRLDAELKENEKQFHHRKELRFFILLSTIMTWALTKPMNPDDPELPFQETDYRKRKPHPNYKAHAQLEKKVVKLGKKYPKRLQTLVIGCGVTYGLEESDLAVLFEWAWLNSPPELPLFGHGKYTIPLIHIKDLAYVVLQLLQKLPSSKKQYILAVEQFPAKLRQIVKALSNVMGTGEFKKIVKEEAFLYPEVTQQLYEKCTVNLIMEPQFITSELDMKWQSDLNLPQNMLAICHEYKVRFFPPSSK